ncbi:TPR repeat region-containing protein [Mycolicibacterium sp. XJ775]
MLDAFYSTWTSARKTFGQGAPQDGATLDQSSKLTQMKTGVEAAAPDARWQGPASEAYAAKNKEHAGVYGKLAELDQKMAAEVTNASNVVATGRKNLDNIKSWVDTAAAAIPSGTSAIDRDSKLLSIASQGIGKVSEVITTSNAAMSTIGGRVDTIKSEWQAMGNRPGGPKESPSDIRMLGGDIKDGEDKENKQDGVAGSPAINEQARKDVDAALKGDKDAQQRVKLTLDSIGGEKLSGNEKLDPTQAAYLSQMQAQQKLRSVDELDEAAKKGASGIMADSWNLMSNPNIEFPKTESIDGALQSEESVRGGFDKLPDGVRSTLESPGIEQSENLQKIADIANTGNGEHFSKGTDFDRGMMHKVADMMESPLWRSDDAPFRIFNPVTGDFMDLPGSWDDPRPPHAALEKVASDVMLAVHNDHQVIHDAITGDVASGNPYGEKFKVNSEHLMYNLTHEAWGDRGTGAGSLFEWTKSAAIGPEEGIAASTAHTYGEYLGTHSKELMHLSGDDTIGLDGKHTLGGVNPHLTNAMATGLTPYIDNIAGLSNGLPGFEPLDTYNDYKENSLPNTKGLFAVLSSEESSAKLWSSEVYKHALAYETAFAVDPQDPNSGNKLNSSATLRGLVDDGLVAAHDSFAANQNEMNAKLQEWKEFAYDAALEDLKVGSAALPGGIAASPAIGVVGASLRDEILGTTEVMDPNNPISNMSDETASARIVSTVAQVGGDVHLPQAHYNEQGRLVGYPPGSHAVMVDGQIVRPPEASFDEHAQAVQKAAETVVGGHDPLQKMITKYNGITEEPNPHDPAKRDK